MSGASGASPTSSRHPTLSVGIPVRNVERTIAATLDSVLAQADVDLEVVISDNASEDATEEICRSYAARDRRVRYVRQPRNRGQIANFNHVLALSCGRYFRWLGANDWLDPAYARNCVALLDEHPEKILVTTRYEYIRDDGTRLEAGWEPGPSGTDPLERLREMLTLLNSGFRAIDPVYSMMRRAVLEHTGSFRRQLFTDQLLAVELSIHGPYGHVPRILAARQHPRFMRATEAARIYGVPPLEARFASIRLLRAISTLVDQADLAPAQRRTARRAIAAFYLERHANVARRRLRKIGRMVAPGSTST